MTTKAKRGDGDPTHPSHPLPGSADSNPMSLVAYDASSDEEDAGEPPSAATAPAASSIGPQPRPPSPSTSVGAAPQPAPPPPAPTQNVAPTSSSNVLLPTPSLDLPDVADLFAPPSVQSLQSTRPTDYMSRENASRKRESNGSAFHDSRSKFPRTQSQPRGARSAAGNTLIPPQLRGRSNVVTEDMSKLFVAKRKE
ncbi:hypothetical protein ACP70R_036102 [Stipagrostis hirtigluma subsp. patula]